VLIHWTEIVVFHTAIETLLCITFYGILNMAPHNSRDQSCVIPLALATRNLFHNFLSLRSLLSFKINILVCLVFFCYSISYVVPLEH